MGCTGSNHAQEPHELLAGEALGGVSVARASFHEGHVLTARLGSGSVARLYAAQRLSGEGGQAQVRQVTVKITDLRSDRVVENARLSWQTLRRVEREAAILRHIGRQRHCVAYVDAFVERCFSYIVMEACEMTLMAALECSAQITELTLKPVFEQMLQSIKGIHAAGVVHRDIRPDNFLWAGGRVKLCGFGAAEVTSASKPQVKGICGAAAFMSPEMLAGVCYDGKTDVWGLGATAYVLLLGQFPYAPAEPTRAALKAAIAAGTPEPSFSPASGTCAGSSSPVSAEALRFLRSLLARDPRCRPAAHRALSDPWLSHPRVGGQPQCAPSLRPMFEAAKSAGAFELGIVGGHEYGVEPELLLLQAKFHKAVNAESDSDSVSTTASLPSTPASGSSSRHGEALPPLSPTTPSPPRR